MTDIVDRATRSRMMSGIRGRDTAPELAVRSFLHRAGLRFLVAPSRLPGRPDIVLPKWGAVVFVHGCFWHRHPGCPFSYTPKSNRRFWNAKFKANVERDAMKSAALRRDGWRVTVIWGCEVDEIHLRKLVMGITKKPAGRSAS